MASSPVVVLEVLINHGCELAQTASLGDERLTLVLRSRPEGLDPWIVSSAVLGERDLHTVA